MASPSKFRGLSDRGEQMKHRSQNLHERHMSDIRGAVGCYFCWLGQYDKCKNSCSLVRVTDRDHNMAASGGAADHRDVLYRWDHAAPVLTHAAKQLDSFYNIAPPKEASRWIESAAGAGGKHFFTKRDFISVSQHIPENNPWITSSRTEENRALLKSISQNIHQAEIDKAERHRKKHETKLFSLLLPEQFIPPYKYPHGSVTVQATPYTQIAMKQPTRTTTRGRSLSPTSKSNIYPQSYAFNDEYHGQIAAARAEANEQRRRTNAMLQGSNRPVFMHTKTGGRYVTADSSIFAGGNVKGSNINNKSAEQQLREAEEDFLAAQNGLSAPANFVSTAEQLRAALEGRSLTQLKEDRLQAVRARSAGIGGKRGTRAKPSVQMAETAGQVLSGRYTNAMAMPLPESFSF